jgi:hypothetical protein
MAHIRMADIRIARPNITILRFLSDIPLFLSLSNLFIIALSTRVIYTPNLRLFVLPF